MARFSTGCALRTEIHARTRPVEGCRRRSHSAPGCLLHGPALAAGADAAQLLEARPSGRGIRPGARDRVHDRPRQRWLQHAGERRGFPGAAGARPDAPRGPFRRLGVASRHAGRRNQDHRIGARRRPAGENLSQREPQRGNARVFRDDGPAVARGPRSAFVRCRRAAHADSGKPGVCGSVLPAAGSDWQAVGAGRRWHESAESRDRRPGPDGEIPLDA